MLHSCPSTVCPSTPTHIQRVRAGGITVMSGSHLSACLWSPIVVGTIRLSTLKCAAESCQRFKCHIHLLSRLTIEASHLMSLFLALIEKLQISLHFSFLVSRSRFPFSFTTKFWIQLKNRLICPTRQYVSSLWSNFIAIATELVHSEQTEAGMYISSLDSN